MSTDTAFALGMLALVGPKNADRLRSYLLTFAVVDDFTTIVIIALVYSHHVDVPALLAGLAALAAVFLARAVGLRQGAVYAGLGLAAWAAFFKSGVDPAVSGMVIGLLTPAYPAARGDPGAGHRLGPPVQGAAHAGDGQGGQHQPVRGHIPERAAAGHLPPVGELPDRAVVRTGQRRAGDQRGVPGASVHLAADARHPRRVRRGQADRGQRAPPGW